MPDLDQSICESHIRQWIEIAPNPNHPMLKSGEKGDRGRGGHDEALKAVKSRHIGLDGEGFWSSEFLSANSVAESEGTFVIGHVTIRAELAACELATLHISCIS